jgi:glutathione S-transferase
MMKLFISNKPYSPWPFRVWLLMRELGLPFEEQLVDLSLPQKAERLKAVSPSGRLPTLVDGDVIVWDSMSIIEYLHERFPGHGVWPEAAGARAHARSIAAEMHAGFGGLRGRLIMNMRREPKAVDLTPPVLADIERITDIWAESRKRFGVHGPFLHGAFSASDAVYAPIVSRFYSYNVSVPPDCREYMETIRSLEGYKAWRAGADADPFHNVTTDNL